MSSNLISAIQIINTLQNAGYEAYIAGGYVRDMLLGVPSNDIDIATNALPEQVESLFDKTIAVGKQFGVIVVVKGFEQFEIATFRIDGNYSDGRHPDVVTFSTAKEDAKRRDFTINAMFYDPINDKVIDYVGGQQDLELGIIKCVGDPVKRFTEDPLRMLRAIRFVCKFGFEIETNTYNAIVETNKKRQYISPERIFQEVTKILTSSNACNGIVLLYETGMFYRITQSTCKDDDFDRLVLCFLHLNSELRTSYEQLSDVHEVAVWSMLLYPNGNYSTDMALYFFKCSNQFKEAVKSTIFCMFMMYSDVNSMSKVRLKHIMNNQYFLLAYNLKIIMNMVNRAYFKINHRSICDWYNTYNNYKEAGTLNPPILLTGQDLIDIGYKQGKTLGKILQTIRNAQLNDEIFTKEDAILFAKNSLKS